MARYQIYHNPRCGKSRQALTLLRSKKIEPQIIEYLKKPPTFSDLKKLRSLLKVPGRDMVRAKEAAWKATKLDAKKATDDQILRAIAKEPILLERPIVVRDAKRAVIGRPPENVKKLL